MRKFIIRILISLLWKYELPKEEMYQMERITILYDMASVPNIKKLFESMRTRIIFDYFRATTEYERNIQKGRFFELGRQYKAMEDAKKEINKLKEKK